MAAVPRIKPLYVGPPGYEVIDRATANEIILPGELIKLNATGMSKVAAGALDFDGVALQEYYAGQESCDYLVQGEMGGFNLTGVNPGTNLGVSPTVAGGIDTTITASSVIRMKALTNGRIRFNCV
jgi:hypothetical protein